MSHGTVGVIESDWSIENGTSRRGWRLCWSVTALERRKDCVEIHIVLELRCLDVAVSSWVFEICPMEPIEEAETNHLSPHLSAGSPLTPSNLITMT